MSALKWIIIGVVAYFGIDAYDPNIIPDRYQLLYPMSQMQWFVPLVLRDVLGSITPIVQYEYFSLVQKPLGLSR
jgi:hypothetical protein